jgi:hypothetical protein
MKKITLSIITALLFIFSLIPVYSQETNAASVSGFVYDKANGEALIGAVVSIKDLKIGAISNKSGYFVINDVPVGKQTVLVTYVGYKNLELNCDVKPGEPNKLKIILETQPLQTDEVVITANSENIGDKLYVKPISKIEMDAKEVNSIPRVIEADLLRALQTMPGITALSDFSSALYVRGGTPDQNLYRVDGADVYNPEHAFGIFSTFNTDAIKKVEVSKGGFSSEYGGRLSSVIDVTNLDGNRNNFEGTANVSLISASTTLQMPLGSFGSLSGSFRRTYIDQTYAKWDKDIPNYYFYDGNLKGFFDLGENDKLSASFFKSYDNLDYIMNQSAEQPFTFLYNWGNTTGSANWKHIFSPEVFANFWATTSEFKSDFNFSQFQNLSENNQLNDYTLKSSIEYYSSNELKFILGAEYKRLRFIYQEAWDNGRVDVEQNCNSGVAYINTVWDPDALWNIETGLRANYFNSDKSFFNLEPRFSIKFRLNETSSLKFATGIYHQYLDQIQRLFFSSIWAAADNNINASSSDHFILGYQKDVADIFEFETEAYYKSYKNIYEFNQNLVAEIEPTYFDNNGNPVYTTTKNLFVRGDGNTIGLEFLLRKDVGTVNGWISLSLSHTNDKFDGINQGNSFAPRYDRTAVVNFVLNGDIGDIYNLNWNNQPVKKSSKWLLGLSFIYATGEALTLPSSAYLVNEIPDQNLIGIPGTGLPGYQLYPGEIDSYRLPAYIRMDISITYEKDYGSWTLAPYLQIFNIGDRKNVWFINYNNSYQNGVITQTINKINMLPILPSIGVNVKF